jgi:hypothetical protein
MEAAISLLFTAQMLLTTVLGNPSLPQDFKDNANAVAHHAIAFAQAELNKPREPLILASLPEDLELRVKRTETFSASGGAPYGSYGFEVKVVDSQGRTVQRTVTLQAADNLYGPSVTSSGYFLYVPTQPGIKTLRFSTGTITSEYTLSVQ